MFCTVVLYPNSTNLEDGSNMSVTFKIDINSKTLYVIEKHTDNKYIASISNHKLGNQKYIRITCPQGNIELVINMTDISLSKFLTGLRPHDSGSTGPINEQCARDLLLFIKDIIDKWYVKINHIQNRCGLFFC